jgi:ABC-type branched-subunit amino acid transport system substrate-binding protein
VEKTILVGACQDFSGPTAQASGRLWTCAQEFFKWANETEYVPGIKVEWTEVDDRYDAAQVPLAYRELKAKNPDVIFTMTAVSSAGLKNLVDRDKIPVLSFTGSVATAQEPPGYVFQLTFVPEINFNCFLNYVADTWTEDRPCKVASLSWDDNDGTQHIESGIETAAALGIDFKREYAEIAPPGTGLGAGPFTPYITRLKELDPDYIFFPMIGPATGVALKEMMAMGMDPSKAVYIVMSAGGMYEELTAVLGSEEPTHGATLVMADYSWSIQTDDQERLRSFMEPTDYGWDARYHVNALSYYTSCKVLYEALRILLRMSVWRMWIVRLSTTHYRR